MRFVEGDSDRLSARVVRKVYEEVEYQRFRGGIVIDSQVIVGRVKGVSIQDVNDILCHYCKEGYLTLYAEINCSFSGRSIDSREVFDVDGFSYFIDKCVECGKSHSGGLVDCDLFFFFK